LFLLESLVHDGSLNVSGTLEDDIPRLQEMLEADVPAYLLVRMDSPSVEWLAIFYVPDSAKVRDKVSHSRIRIPSETLTPIPRCFTRQREILLQSLWARRYSLTPSLRHQWTISLLKLMQVINDT